MQAAPGAWVGRSGNFLLQTPYLYDIITTAAHPVNTSSWALFMREFYESVAARLVPDGVFLQWLPFHNLRQQDYKRILRTFQHIFPHVTPWYTGGSHTLVLATQESLTMNMLHTALLAATNDQIVINNLGPPAAWASYLAETLRTYVGDGPLTTDNDAFFYPTMKITFTSYRRCRRQCAEGAALQDQTPY